MFPSVSQSVKCLEHYVEERRYNIFEEILVPCPSWKDNSLLGITVSSYGESVIGSGRDACSQTTLYLLSLHHEADLLFDFSPFDVDLIFEQQKQTSKMKLSTAFSFVLLAAGV